MGMLEESVSPLVFSSIIYVFAFKLLSNKYCSKEVAKFQLLYC